MVTIYFTNYKDRGYNEGGKPMNPEVYDAKEGIDLFFPLAPGYGLTVFLTDKSAQEMINIIQNKLNARL